MSLIQIILIESPYLVLVYLVYHDSVVLHEQQHLDVRIANHKHRVLATRLSLTYTSSTPADIVARIRTTDPTMKRV